MAKFVARLSRLRGRRDHFPNVLTFCIPTCLAFGHDVVMPPPVADPDWVLELDAVFWNPDSAAMVLEVDQCLKTCATPPKNQRQLSAQPLATHSPIAEAHAPLTSLQSIITKPSSAVSQCPTVWGDGVNGDTLWEWHH